MSKLVTTLPDGERTVETLRTTHEYWANGTLRSEERVLHSGATVSREYYDNGHLSSKQRTHPGRDDKRSLRRAWSEGGYLQSVSRVHRNGHIYGRTRNKQGHLPLFKTRLDQRRFRKQHHPAPKKQPAKQIRPLHRTH